MIKFTRLNKSETWIELEGDEGKMIIPSSLGILVDDLSDVLSIKTPKTRKTIAIVDK